MSRVRDVFDPGQGPYQTGIAEIRCMHAPEFNGHSESIALDVK